MSYPTDYDNDDNPDDEAEWFGRERRRLRRRFWPGSFFSEMENWFDDLNRTMEEELRRMVEGSVPKDYVREKKLPTGQRIREFGPFVYGYSMKVDENGRPTISEFGNVRPKVGRRGERPGLQVQPEREPLVDVLDDADKVTIVVEIPGVDKEDIEITADDNSVLISADGASPKYRRSIRLPADVKVEEAKSTYKNGILQIVIPRVKKEEKKTRGTKIDIN